MKELLEHVLIQLEPSTNESTGESNVGIADHRPSLHWQIVNHDTDVFDVNAAYGQMLYRLTGRELKSVFRFSSGEWSHAMVCVPIPMIPSKTNVSTAPNTKCTRIQLYCRRSGNFCH